MKELREEIKQLVCKCEDEALLLAMESAGLITVQNTVKRLLDRFEDFQHEFRDEQPDLVKAIGDFEDDIRLIDLALKTVTDQMIGRIDNLAQNTAKIQLEVVTKMNEV